MWHTHISICVTYITSMHDTQITHILSVPQKKHIFHHLSMSESWDMCFITFLCVSPIYHVTHVRDMYFITFLWVIPQTCISSPFYAWVYFITFLWVSPQTCISSPFYEWGLRHVFHHLSMSESSDMYFIIFLWVSPVYHVTHLFPQSHASDQLFCTAAPYERTHSVSCEEPPRISAAVIRTPIQSLIKGEPPFSPFLRGSTNFSSPLSEDLFVSCWRCSTAPYERTHRVPFEEPPRTSAAFMIRLIESLFKGLHKC